MLLLHSVEHNSRRRCQIQEGKELRYYYRLEILDLKFYQRGDYEKEKSLKKLHDLSEVVNIQFSRRKVREFDYLNHSSIVLLTADLAMVFSIEDKIDSCWMVKTIELTGIASPINCVRPYQDSFYFFFHRNVVESDAWKRKNPAYSVRREKILGVLGWLPRDWDESQEFSTRDDIGLLSGFESERKII